MTEIEAPQISETILVVDDEPVNISVFGELLSPHYKVLVALNGHLALQLASNKPKPDMILLDVMMPDMDGYQVLTRLKADPETMDIPVILVTALNSDLEEQRGFELGAVDFINKPCRLLTLLARVRTQLELKKTRDWLKQNNDQLKDKVAQTQQENEQVHLQLLQSEKLAAIGQLAAGIAHEINNPIGFVYSNLNTLRAYIQDIFEVLQNYDYLLAHESALSEDVRNNLQTMRTQKDLDYLLNDAPQLISESIEGLSRVRNIVQDLKSFSHSGTNEWLLSDIHQCLNSTLNIIWNELKYHCTVEKKYGDIPLIFCHVSQINQVFMNLLINAGQAIKGTGVISISTGVSGKEVWVEISDTGEGIAAENLHRLFEPFFTTKAVGKGTGLGLSISHNIVKLHHGRIDVKSKPGFGSSFRVYLPIMQDPEAGVSDTDRPFPDGQ